MNKLLIILVGAACSCLNASEYISSNSTSRSALQTSSEIPKESITPRELKKIGDATDTLVNYSLPNRPPLSFFESLVTSAFCKLTIYGLDPFLVIVDLLTNTYGAPYETLSVTDRLSFCTTRAIECFFRGDLVNASAFLLETRQLRLLNKASFPSIDLSPLAVALLDVRQAIDARSGSVLTPEQTTERLLFKLHLTKLFPSNHPKNPCVDPKVFMVLATLGPIERDEIKKRNPQVYGHGIYLMAQYVAKRILDNQMISETEVAKVMGLVLQNLGFFTGGNLYREEGQRAYLCLMATTFFPDQFDQSFDILKDFTQKTNESIAIDFAGKIFTLDAITHHVISRKEPVPYSFFSVLCALSSNLGNSPLGTVESIALEQRKLMQLEEATRATINQSEVDAFIAIQRDWFGEAFRSN